MSKTFESVSNETPQFKAFATAFMSDIKKILLKNELINKPEDVKFSKLHFEVSAFIQLKNDKIFYINTGDVRLHRGALLLRTAKDFKDYTGGKNEYILFSKNFENQLVNRLRKNDYVNDAAKHT